MTENENIELAELLFGEEELKTREEYEEMYPYRKLGNKSEVTRLAPSPTGFMHLGNLYSALADERIAHTKEGVFFLRIEDTDAKRKVEGAVELVIDSLKYFGIEFDEGEGLGQGSGIYGPYTQSERKEIYHTFAKELVEKGLAYPCFCEEDELEAIRKEQEEKKELTGYYGRYAVWREKSLDEIKGALSTDDDTVDDAEKVYLVALKME